MKPPHKNSVPTRRYSRSTKLELVEAMHSREQDDWTRFGLRQEWEKRYRDPQDVLIEAERLRKKLRKSAGKRRKGGSHA